ncbi:MAG: peptide-methionine (S)-S-oxide reductase MsrA [Stappiaceae bacterium]
MQSSSYKPLPAVKQWLVGAIGRPQAFALMGALALGTAFHSPALAASETAIFAGGCFWCVESDFEKVKGVTSAVSGYTGGHTKDVTYKKVTAGGTGHREAVKITFDPDVVSYGTLVDIFWRSVNPTDAGGQFCDRGESYSTAIYTTSKKQTNIAQQSKERIDASGILKQPIVTPIKTAGAFYNAEDYHQDYHNKSPLKYKFYRYRCGRDQEVRALWGNEAHAGIPTN